MVKRWWSKGKLVAHSSSVAVATLKRSAVDVSLLDTAVVITVVVNVVVLPASGHRCCSYPSERDESAGSQANRSNGQVNQLRGYANGQRGQMNALMVVNTSETAAMSDSGGTGPKSGARDVKHDADATDSLGSWSDASSGHRDMPGIHNTDMSADATEYISTHQNPMQTRNLSVEPAI